MDPFTQASGAYGTWHLWLGMISVGVEAIACPMESTIFDQTPGFGAHVAHHVAHARYILL